MSSLEDNEIFVRKMTNEFKQLKEIQHFAEPLLLFRISHIREELLF